MDGGSPSTSSTGDGGDPSTALDQLFLELHDELPKGARGKLAKLADEVKKLTETSTSAAQTTPRHTPPTSSDQELVRREGGIVEARQTSGELAQGVVVTSLSDQPTLRDIVCFAVPHVAPKWYDVGIVLDVKTFVLDGVASVHERADRPREMFVKWLQKCAGTGNQARTWKRVLDAIGIVCGQGAVEEIQTAVQAPRCPTTDDHEEPKTPEQSPALDDHEQTKPTELSSALEIQRKRPRSSTQSSEEIELERQPKMKRQLQQYMKLKMDLFAQDMADLRSESDPGVIIRLLYGNSLTFLKKMLNPHFAEVKKAADQYCRLGLNRGPVGENVVASADSVDSLLNQMSVTEMWDNTRFLRKAVGSIPLSAPERDIADAILSHYNVHLAIYERATLLKGALANRKESKNEEDEMALSENAKRVPVKITALKAFDNFTSSDCHHLQVQLLSKQYGIPEEKIICHEADEVQSTTVTFLIPSQYTHTIIQRSIHLETLWVLLELGIIEISVPGVFTLHPSVRYFLTLLRDGKHFTADLLRVTEILPYQMYCLIDSEAKEPLSDQPLCTKRIEQCWDSQDVSDPRSSVQESQDKTLAIHSADAVIPPEGAGVGAPDEAHSRVCELEGKVKDLERKVANLFMDNVALTTKLKASREVERQQHDEITRLKERLVQAMRAQETATPEQSLSKTRELDLENRIKSLEAERSDLETTVDKLEKQIMLLEEIRPSDIEQLIKPSVGALLVPEQSEAATTTQPQHVEGTDEQPTTQDPSTDQQVAVSGETDKIREEEAEDPAGEAFTEQQGPSTDELETVTEGTAGSKDRVGKDSTEVPSVGALLVPEQSEAATTTQPQRVEGTDEPSTQQEAVGGQTDKIKEEESRDPTGETSAVTEQPTGDNKQLTLVSARPPVVEAAKRGQLSTVRQLLDGGAATVEDQDEEGRTALLWASWKGHLPVVKELVDVHKVNVFQKMKDGTNALHMAAQGGHIDVIKYLATKFGARAHDCTDDGYTMLHWASQMGHSMVARYLIQELQLDPQDRDKWGYTALLRAAQRGHAELARMLLQDFGSKVNEVDQWGNTALLRAAKGGSVELAKILLEEYSSSVDEVNEYGMNAMHKAAEGGHLVMVKYLAPLFGDRVHEKDKNSFTALHWASKEGHCEVTRYLLEELKMDPQDRDKWGTTALLRAAYGGSVELAKMLLEEYSSSIDEVTEDGHNAMHKAAVGGHLVMVKYLAPLFGDRVHEKDKSSCTALHWASQEGHCEVARYLMEELKMDPQDRDKWGCTALLRAARNGHAELARMLLQDFGSKVNEVDQWGLTAMLKAACGGHAMLVRMLLEEFGSTLDEEDNDGWTAVLCSAAQGHLDMLRELVEHHGADLYHKAKDGRNALHIAATNGHLEMVKYLLPQFNEKKFDKSNNGETCLDWAIRFQKQEVVDYLLQEGGFATRWQQGVPK